MGSTSREIKQLVADVYRMCNHIDFEKDDHFVHFKSQKVLLQST